MRLSSPFWACLWSKSEEDDIDLLGLSQLALASRRKTENRLSSPVLVLCFHLKPHGGPCLYLPVFVDHHGQWPWKWAHVVYALVFTGCRSGCLLHLFAHTYLCSFLLYLSTHILPGWIFIWNCHLSFPQI